MSEMCITSERIFDLSALKLSEWLSIFFIAFICWKCDDISVARTISITSERNSLQVSGLYYYEVTCLVWGMSHDSLSRIHDDDHDKEWVQERDKMRMLGPGIEALVIIMLWQTQCKQQLWFNQESQPCKLSIQVNNISISSSIIRQRQSRHQR